MEYNRPATTIDEKISILENRGLIVTDHHQAQQTINAVGYFRLKGYCLTFYGKQYEQFLPNTTITDIYQVYQFDAALRALMLSACQQIEVRVKAAIGDVLPLKYGPMLSEDAFLATANWRDWTQSIRLSRRRGS
ncbi:Abi family protein [Lacticaseibacillus sp. N501-2]|uniref:Abi family protein n=1 Tax=Lacticaseibacillus salsurae TaxID=3367729 RepID=UPI0038B39F8F